MAADPYLQLTFDAKRRIALAARSVDLPPGSVAWGMWEVWEDVWRRKDARVPALVLAGCLGPDQRLPAALVAFGFLVVEADGGHRITLEDERRILWTHQQRVAAGKARAASGTRSAGGALVRRSSDSPAANQRPTSGQPAGAPAANQRDTSSLQPAASSQQPAEEDLAGAAGAAPLAPAPEAQPPAQKPAKRAARQATNGAAALVLEPTDATKPPRALSEAESFFAEWQVFRHARTGLVAEAPPPPAQLNAWYAAAVQEVGKRALVDAASAYVESPRDGFWRAKGFPFRGFMSENVWRQYVPPKEVQRG